MTAYKGKGLVNGYSLYYWRKDEGQEVDYIVQRGDTLLAIEVKSGRRTDNDGLHIFADRYRSAQTLVVGSGGFPIDKFLLADIDKLLK